MVDQNGTDELMASLNVAKMHCCHLKSALQNCVVVDAKVILKPYTIQFYIDQRFTWISIHLKKYLATGKVNSCPSVATWSTFCRKITLCMTEYRSYNSR